MQSLFITYTYGLRGDLALLPKLYTFQRGLVPAVGDAVSRRVLRVDLGDACAPERWPCDVTGGRAAYLALDAMGYTAANVHGVLSAADRDKLRDQVALGLVDDGARHRDGGIVFSLDAVPLTGDIALNVRLTPADATRLDGRRLRLAPVARGTVGVVKLAAPGGASDSAYALESFIVHALPPGTNPDPTIAGVIDFIEGEARYYQKRQDEKRDSGA